MFKELISICVSEIEIKNMIFLCALRLERSER